MILEAANIKKSYGTLAIVKQASLQVAPGEFVAIVGPSGAGKSTLLHILGCLERGDAGTVSIDGTEVSGLDAKATAIFRNKHIGFVFQAHYLLPEFSALENVMLPLLIAGEDKAQATKAATEMLASVGLAERLSHKPTELSGGEQQRIAIARAVVAKPKIIFADEPTGNLDTATATLINQLFLDLAAKRNISLVVVTHNEALAALADRVLQMKDGVLAQ